MSRRTRCDAWWLRAGALLALLVPVAACGPSEQAATAPAAPSAPAAKAPPPAAEPAGAVTESARAAADEIFRTRCFTCHGAEGRGDGPASAALSPQPRNFQDADWQKSVSDEHIAQIIQYGGAAVGKSPSMPSNPDLSSRPAVVAALVEHVRELGSR